MADIPGNFFCAVINYCWLLLCRREYKTFAAKLREIDKAQKQLLFSILDSNRETLYGKKYDFGNIQTINQFKADVPITEYEDYKPLIDKIAQHGNTAERVLTSSPVLMFEPTSGSSSPSKYVPYTKELKKAFLKAVRVWIYDLYTSHRKLLWGKSYWSITPALNVGKKTSGGIPVGFEEDAAYFGFLERFFLKHVLAVPSLIVQIEDIEIFRYVTLLFLLKAKNLRLISVWNPSFLILLLEPVMKWKKHLVKDLYSGRIEPPTGSINKNLEKKLSQILGKNRKRSLELSHIFDTFTEEPNNTLWSNIWPDLDLISCQASAGAKSQVEKIGQMFPKVFIQGKGLIATEGIVTFPLSLWEGFVPAFRSHFFEFIECCHQNKDNDKDKDKNKKDFNNTFLLSELKLDKIYSVVLTNGGGFYRYMMHDRVRVTDFSAGCPMIEFIGKEDIISDYFGEKLNQNHVNDVISGIIGKYDLSVDFFMLAPENGQNGKFYYVLFIKLENEGKENFVQLIDKIHEDLEAGLEQNYHYAWCRKLGQILSHKIFIIQDKHPSSVYLNFCRQSGQKLGDIKPVVLHTKTGWKNRFAGEFIK